MDTSPQEKSFLTRRRQLVRAWPIVGPLSLLGLAAPGIFMYITSPLIINPFEVAARLESGTLEHSTLQLMALLLPVILLALIATPVIVLLPGYAVMANDRKYLAIIDRFNGMKAGGPG